MKRTLTLLFGIGCLLYAASRYPAKDTDRQNRAGRIFPSGGAVRLKNSTGELTIEGWDRPGVEINDTQIHEACLPCTGAETREEPSHILDEVKVFRRVAGE